MINGDGFGGCVEIIKFRKTRVNDTATAKLAARKLPVSSALDFRLSTEL
jgi:hypothetical protein